MTSEPLQTGKKRQERVGVVSSDKMSKTIVVEIERRFRHPHFKKIVAQTKKLYAHDEGEQACAGDTVLIQETRPLSRLKRWKLVRVISQSK